MDEKSQPRKASSENEIEEFLQEMKQPSLFDNTKFYRLRSRIVELVEEIKLKRVTEKENEEKIRHLVHEKHELERKQDSKQAEIINLSDEHDHKLQEQKRHLDDQIYSLKEQVKKLQVHREVNEKETKVLKDDIRALQWTKYNLEKKLREQEHMLSAHHMSTDQHRDEISAIEKKMAGMMSHFQHLADTIKRLELNVKEAVSHNKKLMYVNEHKNCEMKELKTENEKLQKQVFETNVKQHLPDASQELDHLTTQIEDLHRSLKQEEEKLKKAQMKADENNRKYEDGLKLLKEAHELTDKHLGNANKHQKESRQYRQKCDDLGKKITTLTSEIDGLKKELHTEKMKYEDGLVSWAQKEKDLTLEVYQIKEQILKKESEILNLEDANSLWGAKNVELSAKLEAAEKHLNIEKAEKETQKGTSQLSLRSEGTQTRLSSQHVGIQTEPKLTKSIKTQCIIAALFNVGTQTLNSGFHDNDLATQTEITSTNSQLAADEQNGFSMMKIKHENSTQTDPSVESVLQNLSQENPSIGDSTQDGRQEVKRKSTPRTSFQLPTSHSIKNQFQAFEKHSDAFRVPSSSFLPSNTPKRTIDPSPSNEAQKRSTSDPVPSNENHGNENQMQLDRSSSSFAPLPKYARMNMGRGLISSPSIATRKTPSTSPFPSMGVKVVASRRESLSEVKTTLQFCEDSQDLSSLTIQTSETQSTSTIYPVTPNSFQFPSNKGILKNPFEYRINTPKSVKFNDITQEKVLSPDLVCASPELVEENHNENEPMRNSNPTSESESFTAEAVYIHKS